MGDLIINGNFSIDLCNCRIKHIIMRSININHIRIWKLGRKYEIDYKSLLKYAISRPSFNIGVLVEGDGNKMELVLENISARNKKIILTFKNNSFYKLPRRINNMQIILFLKTTAFFSLDEKNEIKKPAKKVNQSIYSNTQSGYSAKSFPQTIVEINPWGRAQTSPMVGVSKLPTQ